MYTLTVLTVHYVLDRLHCQLASPFQVGVSALAGLALLSILVPTNLVGEAVDYL